ncbi:glycosyltransferase family 4 protein [Cellulomonas sp.]|uniref:glycosyltransferase family 4 protein n=1 Tax=Cellulomonas sp. TaxID=40001 RepID=UPI002D51F81F|nr:glycosyltransferase family 4 protein [Cellulomonas sp.]HYQ76631.1 glycosyltransferase family 4 protein [Cellulomonas sp.]
MTAAPRGRDARVVRGAPRPRARDVLRATAVAAGVATRMLREDRALLVVQASRRLPPTATARVAGVLLRGGPPAGARRVLGHWVAGHREEAAALLPAAWARARTRPGRRVLAEVAVELDRAGAAGAKAGVAPAPGSDAAPGSGSGAPAGVVLPRGAAAARAAWRDGDVRGALDHARAAGDARLARRLAAEVATLQPGFAVSPAPRSAPRRRLAPAATRDPAALHLLTSSVPHTPSGYAVRSHAVLRAQAAAGVRVAAATRIGYPVSVGRLTARRCDVVDGVPYRRLLPLAPPRTVVERAARTVAELRPLADAFGPTVLHTTTPYGNGQVVAALAAELGVPWVYEVRGLLEQTWVAGRPDAAARDRAAASERFALLRAQEAAVAAAADHVVALSGTLRDDLVARGVPAERVTVVPNGVDARLLTLPDPGPAAARRALGLPAYGFWVGTVSSVVDYEGLGTLVDAVALLRARGLDVRACVVGDGVALPGLRRRAAAAGVADAVLLRGRVPAAAAPRWHQALDAFVVPRRDLAVCRRVAPLKPVEAMALGRPVVASDLPALAEVLPDGSGLLVPPDDAAALADALAGLRADPAAAAALTRAGRVVAAERTWARVGAAYRVLYERLGAAG